MNYEQLIYKFRLNKIGNNKIKNVVKLVLKLLI